MKYTKIINNRLIKFIDKFLRFFGYYIVLTVDIESKELYNFYIKKI